MRPPHSLQKDTSALPPDIAQHMETINDAMSKLSSLAVDIGSGPDQLWGAVQHLSSQVEEIDEQGLIYGPV